VLLGYSGLHMTSDYDLPSEIDAFPPGFLSGRQIY
jgi:hypothetical protein